MALKVKHTILPCSKNLQCIGISVSKPAVNTAYIEEFKLNTANVVY